MGEMNIAQFSLDNIKEFGEYEATLFNDESITNVQQYTNACKLATVLLNRGVSKGDRVVVIMLNSPVVMSAFTATWKIGAAIIPVTPMWTAHEVRYLLEDSGAQTIITSPELASRLEEASEGLDSVRNLLVVGDSDVSRAINIAEEIEAAPPREPMLDAAPDDMAMLLYTSGTTGDPKGVILSHKNLVSSTDMAFSNVQSLKDVRSVSSLPLSHIYGVIVMNIGLRLGSRVRILQGWDTRAVFEAIQELRVNRLSVVPTMLNYMLNFKERDQYDVSSLTHVGSGGAPIPEAVRAEFEKAFDCTVKQGYGLSETAAVLSGYRIDEPYRVGSVGRAVAGVEACILDNDNQPVPAGESGEICARGPQIMHGYLNKEQATREALVDGWLHTGDIGHIDGDGYIFITDRKKDLVIKGAENVSPKEIEEGIYAHPAVSEATVFGVADAKFGENLVAAVVLRHGATLDEAELQEHLTEYVTKFKIPARVVFLDELPKNPTGKIQKRALRDQFADILMNAERQA
jgi:long-chain acyl-CoA synthetase